MLIPPKLTGLSEVNTYGCQKEEGGGKGVDIHGKHV